MFQLILDQAPRARDSRIIAVRTDDVESVIEQNKRERLIEQKHEFARKRATVPNVILLQWLYEEHSKGNTGLRLFTPEFNALVQRKLNDPDWAHLRTG